MRKRTGPTYLPMRMSAASGVDYPKLEIMPTSQVGGREMTRNVSRANIMRQGTVMTYDKARIGFIMPMPVDLGEARSILRDARDCPVDRGIHTDVRKMLLNGAVIGVTCGRKRRVVEHIPDAFLVPYPHTIVLANFIADRVWEETERIRGEDEG